MSIDNGAPQADGLSRSASSQQAVSPVPASIPSADLFGSEAPKAKPLNLITEYLKEREGLHPDWCWHSMNVLDHKGRDPKDWNFTQYEGGVYPFPITRGPRAGRPNYKKPLAGSERVCIVDDRAFREWLAVWETRTGKCHNCKGTGQRWAGCNHKTGDRFEECARCKATGRAPAQAMSASGQDPKGLEAKPASVVRQDAPEPSRHTSKGI